MKKKITVDGYQCDGCERETEYAAECRNCHKLAMLLSYAEDLIFYPALWTFDYVGVTNLLSGGFDYNFPQFLWPWSLGGWLGFVTRWIWGETIKLPTIWAMILSIGTLAGILIHQNYLNAKGQTNE